MTKHRAIELANTLQVFADASRYMPDKLTGGTEALAAVREAIPLLRSIPYKEAEIERLKTVIAFELAPLLAQREQELAQLKTEPQWFPVESLPLPDDAVEYRTADGSTMSPDELLRKPIGSVLTWIETGALSYRTEPKMVIPRTGEQYE